MRRHELLQARAEIDAAIRNLDQREIGDAKENYGAQKLPAVSYDSPGILGGAAGGGSGMSSTMGAQQEHGRISCAELLHSRANELRRRAAELDALASVLPPTLASLSPQADGALWTLVQQMRTS